MEQEYPPTMRFELTGYVTGKYTVETAEGIEERKFTFHPDDFEVEESGYYQDEENIGFSAILIAFSQDEAGFDLRFKLSCNVTQFHKVEWLYEFEGEVVDDQLSYVFEPTKGE